MSSDKSPNTGTKSFSVNTEKFISDMSWSGVSFYFYTVLITFISFYFLQTIRMQIFSYQSAKRGTSEYGDNATRNRILNITHSLDKYFQPLYFDCPVVQGKRYYGLSEYSYFILFIFYGIAYLILLKNMIANYIFTNVFKSIQQNPDVNPYNNPNVVTKIPDSPTQESHTQYTKIISLSLLLLLPILIYHVVKNFEWTQLDIQRSFSIKLGIFLLIFFPPLMILVSAYKLNYLVKGEKYLEEKDKEYVNEMNKRLNEKYFSFFFPLFFFLVLISLYLFAYRETTNSKLWYVGIGILYLFIPLISIFFGDSILTGDYQDPLICTNKGYSNNIETATKTGVHNLYQATVKYNYPCFFK